MTDSAPGVRTDLPPSIDYGVGSLDEFTREGRPNVARFESFERFRRSIRDPEIVTFDELYERAAMSVALSTRSSRAAPDDLCEGNVAARNDRAP